MTLGYKVHTLQCTILPSLQYIHFPAALNWTIHNTMHCIHWPTQCCVLVVESTRLHGDFLEDVKLRLCPVRFYVIPAILFYCSELFCTITKIILYYDTDWNSLHCQSHCTRWYVETILGLFPGSQAECDLWRTSSRSTRKNVYMLLNFTSVQSCFFMFTHITLI